MARLKKHADAVPDARNIHGKLVVKTWRGITVATKWPKKRGPSKRPSEIWWRGTFGTAAQMASRPYHLDQDFAVAWTKNTKFRPEDILTAAALGKLYEFVDPTGTIKGNVLDVAANPQATLDLISSVPGTVLYRSPDGWIGLPPGPPGWFLQQLSNGHVQWAQPPGASGGTQFAAASVLGAANNNDAYATKGVRISTSTPITIHAIWSRVGNVVGASYRAAIYRVSIATIDAVEVTTPGQVAASGDSPYRYFALPTPFTTVPGALYIVAVGRTNGAGTDAVVPLDGISGGDASYPGATTNLGYRLAQANPIVGNTFTTQATPFQVSFGWSV